MGGDLGLDGIEPGGPHAPTPHPPSRAEVVVPDPVLHAVAKYGEEYTDGLQPETSVLRYHGGRIARLTIETLRSLPVEQRMEAMGMRRDGPRDLWRENRG